MIDSIAPYISQTERLALCPVSEFVTIRDDEQESEECAALNNHPLSARNAGFVMPSRARCGVVSILPHGEDDTEQGESAVFDDSESEELPAETWAPYVLPSARNRAAVSSELRSMGISMENKPLTFPKVSILIIAAVIGLAVGLAHHR